jgi:hypothetical protein
MKRTLILVLGFWFGLRGASPAAQDPEGVDFFERKIRPVLAEICYECHSARATKLKGDLLLDSRAGVLKGGSRGPAVVAGDLEQSLLLQAIRQTDPKLKMPPNRKLSAEQIADFEEWIRRGAPDPRADAPPVSPDPAQMTRHWAFQPPREPPVPRVRQRDWIRTPIDAFILAGLEARGLSPSPSADPRALLRRVTYDLTGLPPTPEAVDAFLADPSAEAYEKIVDRLLASPQYGERWARHWLDVARYSDTKGYVYEDRDERRFAHAYPYRDWVVRAFNEDLPYDRFLVAQIAGDRLAGADDRRPLAALGFLTLGRRFLYVVHDIIDDRIDVLMRGTQALTLGCARCHDHKFDPITMKDYYALYGVFAGSAERQVPLEDPPATEAGQAYRVELQKRTEALESAYRAKHQALLEHLRARVPDYLVAVAEGRRSPTEEVFLDLGSDDLRPYVVRQWKAYLDETRKQFHPIFAPWHALAEMPPEAMARRAVEWLGRFKDRLNPRVARALEQNPPTSMQQVAETYGALLLEVHRRWQRRLRDAQADPPRALEDPTEEALRQVLYAVDSPAAAEPRSVSEIEAYFDEATRVELGGLQKQIDQWIVDADGAPPHAVVLEDRPFQREPRVFRRGNAGNPGDEVPRRFLQILAGPNPAPFQDGSGRLELARAIARADNPLTARVMVNRIWQHHFGAGIVRTPSDFGLRSEPPTHPELLDWLACRFVADGWSIKKIHRLIVLSSAYRQSSRERADGREADPENRLLWRMSPRRLDFEQMRDTLLAVSGQLDPAIGGPPERLTAVPASRRRAIYGYVDRLNLPPVFRLFDFANPDEHNAQRHTTTVPLQALFWMNSRFINDQARALAQRPEVLEAPDAAQRVEALYRIIYARSPTESERSLGLQLIEAPLLQETEPEVPIWLYGVGRYDAPQERVIDFAAFPYFTGDAWQGSPDWPDPEWDWAMLNAAGGHAAPPRAVVRRWVAPRDGVFEISGVVSHAHEEGDGIRARIVSSAAGELASWTVHHGEADSKLKGVRVEAGQTMDFVVESRSNVLNDEFSWAPVIRLTDPKPEEGAEEDGTWDAAAQFSGPPPPPLTPLEKYVQALLMSNEFIFVD